MIGIRMPQESPGGDPVVAVYPVALPQVYGYLLPRCEPQTQRFGTFIDVTDPDGHPRTNVYAAADPRSGESTSRIVSRT
jgi:hypothetical protein